MKKVLFIFALVFAVFASMAQMATVNLPTEKTYAIVTTDYNVTNTTATYLLINAPQHQPTTQDVIVQLDSLSGNHTNVAVAVYGRKSDATAWVQIGSTVNWKGTTADTTIAVSNTTANRYRSYKIQYTGTGTGVTKIDAQEFKLYRE